MWARTQEVVDGGLEKTGISASDLAAVGVTNQRETTVVWDRDTGEAVHNAIVWQDTRTDKIWSTSSPPTEGRTGSATRSACRWPRTSRGRRSAGSSTTWRAPGRRAEAGDLAFGNMDTWVMWNLTGGTNGGVHVTDVTNASRTMLMDLRDARLGRRHPRHHGCPPFGAPRHQVLVRGVRRGHGDAGRRTGRRRPRRPAGGHVRPGLLRPGDGEEHVRHRQLHVAEHRHRGGPVGERPAHHACATRSATPTRCSPWRARSPSPARWCSGCGTTWG